MTRKKRLKHIGYPIKLLEYPDPRMHTLQPPELSLYLNANTAGTTFHHQLKHFIIAQVTHISTKTSAFKE